MDQGGYNLQDELKQEISKDILPGCTEVRIKYYGKLDLSDLCKKKHFPSENIVINVDTHTIEKEFKKIRIFASKWNIAILFSIALVHFLIYFYAHCIIKK